MENILPAETDVMVSRGRIIKIAFQAKVTDIGKIMQQVLVGFELAVRTGISREEFVGYIELVFGVSEVRVGEKLVVAGWL